MNKKTTINDVAKEAGVSIATVSRYLGDTNYPVSEFSGKKIKKAVDKLSYTPNIVGRMLKTNNSRDIGIIIPTIINPYYPSLIQGIENIAREKGYNILLCNSQRDEEIQNKYIDNLIQKQIKGLIISSTGNSEAFINKVSELAVVTLEADNYEGFGKVLFDYKLAGYMACSHLIELGHKRISFLTSPLKRQSRKDIESGYCKCMKENKLKNYINIIEAEEEMDEFENGKLLGERVLKKDILPTGIIAVNDMTAFGIMQYLGNNNIKIPDDISIIGFDDIEMSKMIYPPLTTISQPSVETGEKAAILLFDILDGKEVDDEVLKPELIVRASTNKINKEDII